MLTQETLNADQVAFESDSVLVYQPRFADESRTKIKAIVVTPDGRFVEVTVNAQDKSNPLMRDVLLQYSLEEIEDFTRREKALKARSEIVREQQAEDDRIAQERELTFQAKSKALELAEVRNCRDPRIAQRIRKAKSPFEVSGWMALAFSLSLENEVAQ